VRKFPYSVVVLDEIEKAHPDLFNILLQVMDHATLTDNNGRKADFRNVILILTTNAGAREMAAKSLGFGEKGMVEDGSRAKRAIERTFPPEFRNRLDGMIAFGPLSQDIVLKVVDKFVLELSAMLGARDVTLQITPTLRAWLGDKGYKPEFGAREMGRVIQEHVKKPLADEILFGALAKGGHAEVDLVDGKVVVRARAEEPTAPETAAATSAGDERSGKP
jgi:ATP-dependent Clp protease ATP-binding subunit ClpA